jgi:dipeptidyl aminopeptidase/acylaminoacyl peptidase
MLAHDTHKFESRYTDSLIGPLPEARELYARRSPLTNAGSIHAPVILFQGADDKVVLPNQAEAMAEALRVRGIPVTLVIFEGEGHGFRRADTIRRSLDLELGFFAQVFGFEPPGLSERPELLSGV